MAKIKFAYLTGSFKLHNPSHWRRQVLDRIFTEYTEVYRNVLDRASVRADYIRDVGVNRGGKYTADSITPHLVKAGFIEAEMASCLKESAIKDVAANLASYYELSGSDDRTGWPQVEHITAQAYDLALSEMAQSGVDLDHENSCRDNLKRQARRKIMPVTFCRSRDFRILYDTKRDRFFVLLKLLPAKSELGRPAGIGNLTDILTGEIISYNGSSEVLFPVQIGRRNDDWHWQYERFLLPVMKGEALIKTAKLIKRDDDYFLNVSFGYPVPEPYEPETIIGIDRGILFTVAYGITDIDGNIVEMHHEEDGYRQVQLDAGIRRQEKQQRGRKVTAKDFRRRQLDGILHRVANEIITKSIERKSVIVLEDLNIKVRGAFVRSAWQKLYKILAYKSELTGVPFRGGVFAAKSSMICVHCGEIVERPNRGTVVICPYCAKIEHADEAAGINIARRYLYKKKDWEKKGGYRAFHRSFAKGFLIENRPHLRRPHNGTMPAPDIEAVQLRMRI